MPWCMLSLIETGLRLPLLPTLMREQLPQNLTKKMSHLVELDRELLLFSLVVFDDHLETQQGLQGGLTVQTKHHGRYFSR